MNESSNPVSQWWIWNGSEAKGPYPFEFIDHQLKTGQLSRDVQAIRDGTTDWRPVRDWHEFSIAPSIPTTPVGNSGARPGASNPWLGYVVAPAIILAVVGFRCLSNLPGTSSQRALANLKSKATRDLNASKQTIFNQVHPVGQATSVDVHDVALVRGSAGEDLIVYRFTLHWQSPLVSSGFTKLQVTFDPESQAVRDTQILATNGTTNAEAQQMAFDFGRLLGEAARQEQQRRQQDEWMRRQRGY